MHETTLQSSDGSSAAVPAVRTIDWDSLMQAVHRGEVRLVLEGRSGARAEVVPLGQVAQPVPLPGSVSAARLSAREREVLLLLESGNAGAEIAAELGLAVNTVAQHLASARRKLGVRSSSQAITEAREHGLL